MLFRPILLKPRLPNLRLVTIRTYRPFTTPQGSIILNQNKKSIFPRHRPLKYLQKTQTNLVTPVSLYFSTSRAKNDPVPGSSVALDTANDNLFCKLSDDPVPTSTDDGDLIHKFYTEEIYQFRCDPIPGSTNTLFPHLHPHFRLFFQYSSELDTDKITMPYARKLCCLLEKLNGDKLKLSQELGLKLRLSYLQPRSVNCPNYSSGKDSAPHGSDVSNTVFYRFDIHIYSEGSVIKTLKIRGAPTGRLIHDRALTFWVVVMDENQDVSALRAWRVDPDTGYTSYIDGVVPVEKDKDIWKVANNRKECEKWDQEMPLYHMKTTLFDADGSRAVKLGWLKDVKKAAE
ncbi:hypothetical protein G7Y89_g13130 [Cudoniella acicularis]|uniref:Uncharacterized protein n=1 Tax=Cudoniella acicularis TaxID=354080 RepID=A0A8H4R7U9_9HELO|nr:hypothetical protein G7Y89_g13130 [Cudoniella acicularis]